MPLFALPIANTSRQPVSHAPLKSILSQKRKREDDEDSLPELSPERTQSAFSAALTNPLSLTPSEIIQYQTAGLALDEVLPSVRDFPHRGLPQRRRRSRHDRGEDEDTEGKEGIEKLAVARHEREFGLRIHHLGVLTAVLHRCLADGDIVRASRAWALLLRSRVDGKGVELRRSGYWGIGAEILIREGEQKSNNSEEHPSSSERIDGRVEHVYGERRWGSTEGLVKAKDYYERLILEYPYKRQFAGSVNGLDFWPAMLGCEVYGIQYTHRAELAKVASREDAGEYEEAEDDEEDGMEDDEDEYTFSQRVETRRRARADERVWRDKEDIRLRTIAAVQVVTTRMDELMASPPYSDAVQLLRLRAMLALYVGDLGVPGVLAGDMDENDDEGGIGGDLAARRIERRQRRADRKAGLKGLRKEKKRAKKIFEKIRNLGGREAETDGFTGVSVEEDVEEEEEQISD